MKYQSYKSHPLQEKIYSRYSTIENFCSSAKIDKGTLYKIMRRDTRDPNGLTIYKIAEALDLSYQQVQDLISGV